MCAFYDNEEKIKKGDTAFYKNENIIILSANHIKENKTMDIVYIKDDKKALDEYKINIPYKTVGYGFSLIRRDF